MGPERRAYLLKYFRSTDIGLYTLMHARRYQTGATHNCEYVSGKSKGLASNSKLLQDMLELHSSQMLSSPCVRQVDLQYKKQSSSIEFYLSLTRKGIPLAQARRSTRIFHSCNTSCHCPDQFVPGGGPTMRRIYFRN